MRVQLS